jgi:hypothetical protein
MSTRIDIDVGGTNTDAVHEDGMKGIDLVQDTDHGGRIERHRRVAGSRAVRRIAARVYGTKPELVTPEHYRPGLCRKTTVVGGTAGYDGT